MSHGNPQLSSFFSSAAPPPGNCAPDAPAVQPPGDPVKPDASSRKGPPHEEPVHPIPDPAKKGNAVIGKSSPSTLEHPEQRVLLPCAVYEDPKHPTAEPVPVPDAGRGNVGHPIPDPPPRRP